MTSTIQDIKRIKFKVKSQIYSRHEPHTA